MLHEPPIRMIELMLHLFQGYGPAVKAEDEDRHMNVNVTSSGQGTKTVILQIPKVSDNISTFSERRFQLAYTSKIC